MVGRHHFEKHIYERKSILIQTSLKFVPGGPIYNNLEFGSGNGMATVQQQAISQSDVNSLRLIDAYIYANELNQIMACHLFGLL